MSIAEVLPNVRSLSRADRLRLVQLLVADLAREEGVTDEDAEEAYPVWTPYGSHDAAAVMLHALSQKGLSE